MKDAGLVDVFIQEHLELEVINFLFHFKDVAMIGAYGLSIFTVNSEKILKESGKLIIYEPQRMIEYTLRATLADRSIIICNTYDEAIQILEK